MPAIPAPRMPDRPTEFRLSEVLAALSYALDLTEGQPEGHTLRSCVIGMRLGNELGLDAAGRSALYYALLLKDAGCSSNAARMASLFGSADQTVKFRMKFVDWDRKLRLAMETARNSGMGRSFGQRVHHFLRIARTEDMTRELIQIRCDRGAEIARQLGFPGATAEAIRNLDEHWNGNGYPAGRRGEEIPLLGRIVGLAQTLELFHSAHGRDAALRVAAARSGTWFDPDLVRRVHGWRRDHTWWNHLRTPEIAAEVSAAEPGIPVRRDADLGLDNVAHAFAEIIDAKSPYTFRHSTNVARYAHGIAAELGMSASEQQRIYRAGLLHDIGKLGVSSRVLDKPGALTADEWQEMQRHPLFTWEILYRVSAFDHFAFLAATHHEKLDGSGYPWKLKSQHLDVSSRILCVADIYEAITADRPYRAGMPRHVALEVLHRDRGTRLCEQVLAGLEAWLERTAPSAD